jgi:hypothetical protein
VEAPWEVELVVSGGFAGVERKVEVDSSGKYEVEDLQTGAKVEGTLPAATLAQIEEELTGACQSDGTGRPPACADCFNYSLEVTTGSSAYHLVLNDLSLSESPAAPLIQSLNELVAQALGF